MPLRTPLAIALAAGLIAGIALPTDAAAQKRRAAAKPKAPPAPTACTDFYLTANKDWLVANPVPATGVVSSLGELRARSQQQQRELLQSAMTAPQGNVQKLLGDFWASGIDEAAVEADAANPIAPLLERINGIKRAKDIPAAFAALHQVGIPVAFNFSADLDLDNLDRYIGYFGQGGTGLPDPAFYTRQDPDTQNLAASYLTYVKGILTLTGTPADQLDAQALLVYDLETRLARVSKPIAQLRDPRNNFARVPVAELDKRYKRLQVADFLQAQGVTSTEVSLANAELFAELDRLVGSLKPDQWKAYLRFQVGDAMAPYLSKSFRDAEFAFRGRVLRGEAAAPSRDVAVLDAINRAAGPMMAREYAGRYLPQATASRAEAIAGEMQQSLARAVERGTWLSPEAKAEALAKVKSLKVEIGAPDRDLDYTVQPTGRGSFGSNMLIASTWHHREEMRRIGRGGAQRRWDVLPQEPALLYDIAHNRLLVSAAVLQPPVLDLAQEPAAHYGSFGGLVAHELGRSVDIRGRVVDSKDQVRTWWTPQDEASWIARGTPLVAQYGNYGVPSQPSQKVNGTLTRDENMADLAAVELAWDAYSTANPAAEKPAREAFFRGWAQLWRQQPSADAATAAAAASIHAPGQWRANGPLANLPAFGETYGCKAGQPMQRNEAEQAKIWR